MARTPLVSRSPQRPPTPAPGRPVAAAAEPASSSAASPASPPAPPAAARWWQRHERPLWLLFALLLALAAGWPAWTLNLKPPLRLRRSTRRCANRW